jgi:voltage-gated potassium channel
MRRALVVIAIAGALDVIGAAAFSAVEHISFGLSLYWAVTTATTVGYGDVTPKTGAGHVIAVIVMLTVIPLFAATFSLITSAMSTVETHRMLRHIIHHHPDIPDLPSKEKP